MIGQVLGPYRIESKLGEGGMGEVYRARDTRLDRVVAIKVLPPGVAGDADRRARFEREARAVAALSHPNILAIHDVGEYDGVAFAVTELLEGSTLREHLATGPLSVRKAIDCAVQIARGLAVAHDKGLVHRDLKPENVFLLADGQVKILDFGLARQAATAQPSDASPTVASMTDPGVVMGTVGYMSPEQVRGQDVDARSDLFALGAVIHEMLSGRQAFRRDTAAETMTAILKEDPPDLVASRPEIALALDRIVRHCLEKSPAERFQSARDVAFALGALSGSGTASDGVAASGMTATVSPSGALRAGWRLILASAVTGALVLGAAAGYVARGRSAPGGASTALASITYQPVTFDEGFVFAARFAKDGRTIVYSADWDGRRRDVFVASVDSTDSRALGFAGSDLLAMTSSGELALLADQRTIGNPYTRLGTLARASMMGGAPRSELGQVLYADFAPDGALAVARREAARFTLEFPAGHVIDERPTGFSGAGYAGLLTPRVSASGNHVAVFETKGALRVSILSKAGQHVAESRPLGDWWGLAWTPAGELWYSAANTGGRQTAIFALDLGGHERFVYRPPGALTLHDISSQGDVLATFDRVRSRIEVLDPNQAMPRDVTWREGGNPAGFADDGTLLFGLAGDSGGPNGSVDIWRPGGQQPVRIAEGHALALSPDGTVALVSSPEDNLKLTLVPTGVGQPRALDAGPIQLVGGADWHPDGRVVVEITRPGGLPTVMAFAATGGSPARLLPEGLRLAGSHTISPDGSRIATLDAHEAMLLCATVTAACTAVTGAMPGDRVAGWSADGASLIVYQPVADTVQLDAIAVGSGRRTTWKTIHPRQPAVTGFLSLAVNRSGAVMYGYGRPTNELYVIRGLR